MKKYALFDITTGEYSYYDESQSQDVIAILAEKIITSHLKLTNNTLWSIVEENEDGSQLWRDAVGNEIPDPAVVKVAIAAQIAASLDATLR